MLAMAAATQSPTIDRCHRQSIPSQPRCRTGRDDTDLVVIDDVDAMTGNAEFVGIEL